METKQEYKVIHQEAYVASFLINVEFEYQGKEYRAEAQYINGGWGMDDIEVYDENNDFVEDDQIKEIGEKLIDEVNINKNTITW